MEIKDLSAAERVVLVALVHRAVLADNDLSDTESEEIEILREELGADSYQMVAAVATAHVRNLDSLRELLAQITNQEARELIYGTLLKVAISDTVGVGESELLELLSEVWGVKPLFEDFPSEKESGESGPAGT